MLLEFSFFISVSCKISFLVKYNRVTDILKCMFTGKHLHLNLLLTIQYFLGCSLSSLGFYSTACYLEMDGESSVD